MELRWYQKEAVEAMTKATGNAVAVLPTGAGKTVVIAEFVAQAPGKVLIISHVKEILGQNFSTLVRYLDDPVHMYSAGWGMRDVGHVTVAGIQSIYKIPELFADTSVVLIDECHLVNKRNTGMYRQFLNQLDCPVIGLTATPFRLGQGFIHTGEHALFDHLCYDLSHKIPQLQDEGYLSELKSKAPSNQMDTNGLRTIGGDFSNSDMDEKYVDNETTLDIVKSFQSYQFNKWLVFCINIRHCEMVADMMTEVGIPAIAVHSKMEADQRDAAIEAFNQGKVKALVNVNILTTGFDAPDIDCIALLRPTKSASLYSQMVGRGLRVAPNKEFCTILDYAGNIGRLGPINKLNIDKEGKHNPTGKIPLKVCDNCQMYVPLSARLCPECGHDITPMPEDTLELTASELALVDRSKPVRWWPVADVVYSRHTKVGKPDSVKISFMCGTRVFREYLCIEHGHRAGYQARYKLNRHWTGPEIPATVDDFLREPYYYRKPSEIQVDTSGKYPQILDKNYFTAESA